MKPRIARALIVLMVFAALGVLTATGRLVVDLVSPDVPPPPPPAVEAWAAHDQEAHSAFPKATAPIAKLAAPPPGKTFLEAFRYYIPWAIVTPGILWLARRVPLRSRRWPGAVALHLMVPVAAGLPFFCLLTLVNVAFGAEVPTWTVIVNIPWGRVFVLQAMKNVPVYWLLLGAGTVVQISREYAANELRAAELRRSLADAQLDTLKMKLQPHFLFNTLNGIASLAQAGETGAVVRVVEHLGTLLRLSMETSARQFVTLEEELALLEAYLAIEEIRFGDRLRIVRRIEPETRNALVPNLILQPLVENAIEHGLSRRLDASLLEIAARRDGPDLHIAVRDDGPGLPAGWSLAANAGAGLNNVVDRLLGLFPGTSRFAMENGATGGAIALLSVPFADAETTAVAESV